MHNLPDLTKTNFINKIAPEFEIYFSSQQDLNNNNNL